jgi:hypothetical protein
MPEKQLKQLNECANYCSIHIYWILTKFYKCHLHIYKDIKNLVQTNKILNNNIFIEKFNEYDCKQLKQLN